METTILHLSDIHFKRKKNETFREDVKEKMFDAIKKHMDAGERVPDFVAVTGDIAFSGKEYDEAGRFFADLKSQLPGEPTFLAVPGNHDVDRDEISTIFSLHSIVQSKEKIDRLLENPKEINTHINSKTKAFRAFVQDLHPGLYRSELDYFWVKNFKDKRVSFLGLNSCWASEDDNDRNNITLGYPQVMTAIKKALFSNRVLLMHHPPINWLNELDFNRYSGEIFKKCGLILHGHTHTDNALVFKGNSGSCICLGANASYTDDKDGFIGFQFVNVNSQQDGLAVKVWPYRLDTRGRVRFVPDTHRWEGQDGKPYFVLKVFKGISRTTSKFIVLLEIPGDYKEWVREFHSTMDIDLLAKKGEVITVSLPEVYIPIETRNPFYKEGQQRQGHTGRDRFLLQYLSNTETELLPKEEPFIDIEELVGRKKRILLRGGAGTGKTTLLKHLAYTVTHGTCKPSLKDYLPVMIFLKDLWLIYNEELHKSEKKLIFEDLLVLYLEKIKCSLTWKTVSNYLSRHRVLFLIDGLDEVPQHLRADLVDIIAQFQFENKENRFLLTGRPHGIANRAMTRFGIDLHDIEPLNDQMVNDFIVNWFRAVSGRAKGLGEVTAEDMITDIRQHEHISVFTQNPLLLTAVCILYQDGKRIPDQRADLYTRIIDNLINRRFHEPAHPGKESEILEFLMALAFETQRKNRKTIEIDDALEILETIVPPQEEERDSRYKRRILRLFNEIEPGCGLFNCLSSGEVEFTHLTFQEFLAAKYMVYMDIDWTQFLDKGWWEESLLLYTGLISIDRKKKSNEIVDTILSNKHSLLGARALCDFQPSRRDKAVVSCARNQLYRLIESEPSLEKRFQAGVFLGCLGDTRIRQDNMVRVPGGYFVRGSNDLGAEERPQRLIFVDAFMIGIFPVTNQEFKQFVDDRGYHNEEFWSPEGWLWRKKNSIFEPLYWHDRKWNNSNFPVVGISWFEATAYIKWLSKNTGERYRLPTEAEWEKAARGTNGSKYPWGNTFDKNLCNSEELKVNRTTPVGIFPGGKSRYGCFDMAGNVWEWCADWYDKKYYRKSSSRNPQGPSVGSLRVDRGGSWVSSAGKCVSAVRACNDSALRDLNLGMRLARSV